MSYLIDGHNLIPKIPGLNLRQMDDERDLISILQSFCQTKQKNVIVFFDGAPAGYDGQQNYGRVTAIFVRQGQTADSAIKAYLHQLGKQAKNWQVVTSDRQIVSEARMLGAKVLSSDVFSKQLVAVSSQSGPGPAQADKLLSEEEVDEWMAIFDPKTDEEDKLTRN